ncbi:MAG: polyphosphate polymerase domain-containing protein [Candidatus Aureabacteria bacterium]|nr:polyphosphate polymerase domain-containing protein [Candidatus Auribacterota bacterium]
MVLICEKKMTAPLSQKDSALQWLSHACLPDKKYPFGIVSSIYYDTPWLSLYQEKINGDFIKKKVRLRWYDTHDPQKPEQVYAFLEIKSKMGSGRSKTRKPLQLNRLWLETVPLDDPSLSELIYTHSGFEDSIPAGLLPSLSLVYERHRFVCPSSGARVCLDSQIRTGRYHPRLFSSVSSAHYIFMNFIVLEIKDAHTESIPWLDWLFDRGFRSQSVSKYGMGLFKLIHGEIA